MIQIDGSYGEGGGQILRSAVSLGAITSQPVSITKIRANRARPGLQPQHLAAVRAAADICQANLKGDAVGSTDLLFEPGTEVKGDSYQFHIGTAGSTTLVAQTILLPLLRAGESFEVEITGGTHNPMAPTAEYLKHVYAPMLGRFGYGLEVEIMDLGFYPRGGGRIRVRSGGSAEPACRQVTVHTAVLGLPRDLLRRTEEAARKLLGDGIEFSNTERSGSSPGVAVTITSGEALAGFSSLGERGKPMERVVAEACQAFLDWKSSGTEVDHHMADQLVLPAALAPGQHAWTTTHIDQHVPSVHWLVSQFVPISYQVDESNGKVSLHARQ